MTAQLGNFYASLLLPFCVLIPSLEHYNYGTSRTRYCNLSRLSKRPAVVLNSFSFYSLANLLLPYSMLTKESASTRNDSVPAPSTESLLCSIFGRHLGTQLRVCALCSFRAAGRTRTASIVIHKQKKNFTRKFSRRLSGQEK